MARAWAAPGRLQRALRPREPGRDPLPAQGDDSRRSDTPSAATVHDLLARAFPAGLLPRARWSDRRVLYAAVGASSRIVIAISEHARETLLDRYELAPDRVVAIPLGIDHDRLRSRRGVARSRSCSTRRTTGRTRTTTG